MGFKDIILFGNIDTSIGRDIPGELSQTVEEQVQRLIQESTNHENLAQGKPTAVGFVLLLFTESASIPPNLLGYVLGWMPWW